MKDVRHPSAQRGDDPKRLSRAVSILHKRDTRRAKPAGAWEDRIWLPDPAERRPCCDRVKPPDASSGGAKTRLYDHCRSLEHVAHLCGVSAAGLRRAYREAGYKIGRVRKAQKRRRRPVAAELLGVASLRDRLAGPLRTLQEDLLKTLSLAHQSLDAVEVATRAGNDLTAPAEAVEQVMASLRLLLLQARKAGEVERLVAEMEETVQSLRIL